MLLPDVAWFTQEKEPHGGPPASSPPSCIRSTRNTAWKKPGLRSTIGRERGKGERWERKRERENEREKEKETEKGRKRERGRERGGWGAHEGRQ